MDLSHRPGFLVLDVKEVTCALTKHSIDVGRSFYRLLLASLYQTSFKNPPGLPRTRIRELLWFRMRGGARFPRCVTGLGPVAKVKPGFLILEVKDAISALNEHSIVGGNSTG